VLLGEPHHDGSLRYVPDPAPRVGDVVPVRVHVPHLTDGSPGADQVFLRVVRDGEPHISAAAVEGVDDAGTWWSAELRALNAVNSYRFLLSGPRAPMRWLNGAGVHARDVTDASDFRVLTTGAAPDWIADQVVYQVFPDRFARSARVPAGGSRDLPDWAMPAGWDEPVVHRGPTTPRQLYGGDLDGVLEHLDHLRTLGATTLYLTPVFEARSNHRYDAVSFDQVDPLLGGRAALARLLDAAHGCGLRVVGDLTTNHTGQEHAWFRAAQAHPDRIEADFYRFWEHPDHFDTWLGERTLPRLDHRSAALRERLYEGADSVVARWLRAGLDGWRIDVANMTGRMGTTDVAADVARKLRETAVAVRPDAWVLAEHGHDASLDLIGDGWHGTMDYAGFTRPVWTWLGPAGDPDAVAHELTYLGLPIGIPVLPGEAVVAAMRDFHAAMPWSSWTASTSHLDSHDTPRFRTLTGGGRDGGVDIAGRGRARHLVGLALQMTMPGVPSVFAGDEIGLTGVDGEHARTPFPWHRPESWDAPTFDAYRAWIALRHDHVALRRGGLRWAHVGTDSVTFLREHPEQRVLVHAARAAHQPVDLPLAALGLRDTTQIVPLAGERARAGEGGMVRLPSSGPAAHVYLVDGSASA
jgi:alpha-glucosidase